MDEQQRVSTFIETHRLRAPPEFRLLDAVSELGEVAKDAAESTDYGSAPEALECFTRSERYILRFFQLL